MERIGRSFRLVRQSYHLLMQDRELMVLPLLSGAATIAVVVGVMFGFGIPFRAVEDLQPEYYAPLFLVYVAAYAIAIFFQAAVVAGATERMRGGDPTVRSALAAAWRRKGAILMWAVVAATVGMILRAIQERVALVGKIIVGIVGAAWSLATLFIVPVLVLEERSTRESFDRSVTVFKKTWGETVAGGLTLGAASVCAWLTLVAVTGLTAWVVGPIALVVFGVGAVCLSVFFSALQGVYLASLYRYATEGVVPDGFDSTLFRQAFTPKK